ncbi:hypothetical protein D6B99_02745 [Arachidicoccus soli]|uniref:Uncharacterized protein n=1 Tax=Arachidicoccus soli TaxID=2341117 RepID=A0A386HLX6_9BACT|nr:hypothetical protein D6B99_02745 [Arachidicoccus soli]
MGYLIILNKDKKVSITLLFSTKIINKQSFVKKIQNIKLLLKRNIGYLQININHTQTSLRK